jgi:hypothetical protein
MAHQPSTSIAELHTNHGLGTFRERDHVELTLEVLHQPNTEVIERTYTTSGEILEEETTTDYVVRVSTSDGNSFDTVLKNDDDGLDNGVLSCLEPTSVPEIEPMGVLEGIGISSSVAEELDEIIESHQAKAVAE